MLLKCTEWSWMSSHFVKNGYKRCIMLFGSGSVKYELVEHTPLTNPKYFLDIKIYIFLIFYNRFLALIFPHYWYIVNTSHGLVKKQIVFYTCQFLFHFIFFTMLWQSVKISFDITLDILLHSAIGCQEWLTESNLLGIGSPTQYRCLTIDLDYNSLSELFSIK